MNSRDKLATTCNWLMAATAVVFSAVVFVQLFSVPPQSSRAQLAVKPFVPPQPVAAIQTAPSSVGMKPQASVAIPAPQSQASSAAAQQPGSTSAVPAQPGMIREQINRAPAVPIPQLNPHTLPPGYKDF